MGFPVPCVCTWELCIQTALRKVGYSGTQVADTSDILQSIRVPVPMWVLFWSQEHICMEPEPHRGGGMGRAETVIGDS